LSRIEIVAGDEIFLSHWYPARVHDEYGLAVATSLGNSGRSIRKKFPPLDRTCLASIRIRALITITGDTSEHAGDYGGVRFVTSVDPSRSRTSGKKGGWKRPRGRRGRSTRIESGCTRNEKGRPRRGDGGQTGK